MKAILIKKVGNPEVLEIQDIPKPETSKECPCPNENGKSKLKKNQIYIVIYFDKVFVKSLAD